MKRTGWAVALLVALGCYQHAQDVELAPQVRQALYQVQMPATARVRPAPVPRVRLAMPLPPTAPQVREPDPPAIAIGPEVASFEPPTTVPPLPEPGAITIGPEVAEPLSGIVGPPPGVQVPSVIAAFPWTVIPDTAVGDTLYMHRAVGAGGMALDSIRKLAIAGTVPMNVWKVTQKVADYSSGGTPGQECDRHVPGTFAWAVDRVAANPNAFNIIHFSSIHYVRCNDVLDPMPAMSHFAINGTSAQGGVIFNTPRMRFSNTTYDCLIRGLTFRLSLTGTMTQESMRQCIFANISASVANNSGAGGQYTGFGSQTGLADSINPQQDITNMLGLYYEGDESGPRLWALGGGSPRMDCRGKEDKSNGVYRHTGFRVHSSWGGRQPLVGCVGSPEGADPSINNNGALIAQITAYGTVDRALLLQQEVLADIMGSHFITRPNTSTAFGRDARIIANDSCSNAGGSSPWGDTWCLMSIYMGANRWTNPETPQDISWAADADGMWTGADALLRCRDVTDTFGQYSGIDSVDVQGYCATTGNEIAQGIRRTTPQSSAVTNGDYFYPPTELMSDAEWLTEHWRVIGNSFRVSHDGTPWMARDAEDQEQVDWVLNHLAQSGDVGYGVNVLGVDILGAFQYVRPLPAGDDTVHVRNDLFLPRDTSAYQPCTDADNDGICAAAEARYSTILSDADSTDQSNDPDGDGWTNYEEVSMYGTDPTVYDGHEDPRESGALMPPPTYASPNDRRVYIYWKTRTITTGPGTQVDTVQGPHPDSLTWISTQQAQSSFSINLFEGLMVSYDSIDQATGIRQLTQAQVDSTCAINTCPPDVSAAPAGR